MLLQAALNGSRSREEHPAVPLTAAELRDDARACAAAGARMFHVHPRDAAGLQTLEHDAVLAAVAAVVPFGPVGVTTAFRIQTSDRDRMLEQWRAAVRQTSVNLSEPGALDLTGSFADRGIAVEAGLSSPGDAELLADGGWRGILRVLIEPLVDEPPEALDAAAAIHAVLDAASCLRPRLQHGGNEAAWPLLEDAVRRGVDTRIGLEDTLLLPDGRVAAGNAELVAAARELGAGSP
ncbi:3-keto-5-aminohexanoate cleavage protein [Naasia aerilata]|uniref:3-keto-5-aminohexanoate cleavage enzyme n=1 Tax=Naasia aerilata TaxID=1162966 RepID=A0ABM8GAT6_9MICO|nr:3-keto-5-aminohexanoate cleavage protein [Naasia aerilata]BDZ45291.1 3-keto-5-aminohexanoate cleavage enzyme [Naasia aerilata]